MMSELADSAQLQLLHQAAALPRIPWMDDCAPTWQPGIAAFGAGLA